MTDQTPPATAKFTMPHWWGPGHWWGWLGGALLGALVLYYGIGALLVHRIDDDPDFGPGTVATGQSRAVAVAARLVLREIETHKWTANDPFFQPGWVLDNMPNFQQGLVRAVDSFVAALKERDDGDMDLQRAGGLLKYPGHVWMFDPSTSWAPTASSEKMYRNAARNLDSFNERLLTGDAQWTRDRETLVALLDAAIADLDAVAAQLDGHMAEHHSALFDLSADDVFFSAKGRVYGHSVVLRELGWDFAQLLSERNLAGQWRHALDALRAAAALQPLVVMNGAPDSTLAPSHLAAQGFAVLRGRVLLSHLADALRD